MSMTLNHPGLQSSEPPVVALKESLELADAIRRTVLARQECSLESLLQAHPGFTWNQVFLEVDRMSRNGELQLKRLESGDYNVTVPGLSMAQCGEAAGPVPARLLTMKESNDCFNHNVLS